MSRSQSPFILGLLMLNMSCVTAYSPVRREYSVTADGNVKAQDPSWSLLEELASELPVDADGQTESLLMLAKEGAPKDELTKMVTDLKEKIEPWRTDAQATLQKSIDAVHACATAMEGAVAQWPDKKNQCDAQSNSHESCREEESKKFQSMMILKGQTAEKKEIMDTECKVFDDVKNEVRAAKATYSNGNVESYLESVCNDFDALRSRYEDAKKKCAAAKAEHTRVSELYEQAESAHTAEKEICNEKQTQTEVSYCQYALTTKGTCDSYGTCYEDKVAEYKSVKEIVESEEKLKKVEWRVYSRIECLLPVLGTDNADAIEACRKKTYSLEGVAYPDIPGQDTCTTEAAYPGNNAYYTAHMASLPDDAKGNPVAKCVGLSAQVVKTVESPACTDDPLVAGVAQTDIDNKGYAAKDGISSWCTALTPKVCSGNPPQWLAGCQKTCGKCGVVAQASCKPKSTSTGDAGYNDGYRGWYDVQGCGKCLDYCRWVGNSGSGGSPLTKLTHGSSWWSCRLAGDSATYSGKDHFSSWSYAKCSGEGAEAKASAVKEAKKTGYKCETTTGACTFAGLSQEAALDKCASVKKLGGHGPCVGLSAHTQSCGSEGETSFSGCLDIAEDVHGEDWKIKEPLKTGFKCGITTGACTFAGLSKEAAEAKCTSEKKLGGHGPCVGLSAHTQSCGSQGETIFAGCLDIAEDADGEDWKVKEPLKTKYKCETTTGACTFAGLSQEAAMAKCASEKKLGGHGACVGLSAHTQNCGSEGETLFAGCLDIRESSDGEDLKVG